MHPGILVQSHLVKDYGVSAGLVVWMLPGTGCQLLHLCCLLQLHSQTKPQGGNWALRGPANLTQIVEIALLA